MLIFVKLIGMLTKIPWVRPSLDRKVRLTKRSYKTNRLIKNNQFTPIPVRLEQF